MDGQRDGPTEERTDGPTNKRTDGRTDEQREERKNEHQSSWGYFGFVLLDFLGGGGLKKADLGGFVAELSRLITSQRCFNSNHPDLEMSLENAMHRYLSFLCNIWCGKK